MKNIILLIVILFSITSCDKKKDVNILSKTTIEFENPHRKYSPIVKGAILNMSYKLTNTGKSPLLISEIQTSCNCVVTDRTTSPIGAGDFGYINLKFDSKKNKGYIKQHITIIANVDSLFNKSISFETNVIPDSHYKKDYEEIYFTNSEITDFAKNYVSVKN